MSGGASPMRRPPVDPGLQSERTWLAWSRTGLAFAASGGLTLHTGHDLDHWAWMIPGATVLAASLLVYALGTARHRRVDTAVRAGAPVTGTAAIVAAAVSSVLTVAAAATVMAPDG